MEVPLLELLSPQLQGELLLGVNVAVQGVEVGFLMGRIYGRRGE